MPSLIERGYVYIAQPPLFKVKRKKQERYIKDEISLEKYLLECGTEGSELVPHGSDKSYKGNRLLALMDKALKYKKLLEKLHKKQWDKAILSALAFDASFTRDTLKVKENLTSFIDRLKANSGFFSSVPSMEYSLIEDAEHSCYAIKCLSKFNGIKRETLIDFDLIVSTELEELRKMADALKAVGSPPFVLKANEERSFNNFSEVLDSILASGEKGQEIQRYKGLGEMNPDQLWETTMNPEKRTLFKVQIEDAIEADEIFTILMGDQVEPRKEFIYANAINVTNLDI